MPSRRQFLMTAIGAAAVGVVALVTTRLGSRARDGALQSDTGSSPGSPQNLAWVPRSEWGAVEPRIAETGRGERALYDAITNPNGWLIYDQPLEEVLDLIVIHHSALPLSDGPREIQQLHQEERGFADVGYHYILDEEGRLYEGRPLNVRGAHTFGHNYASVGICLMGNFEEIPVPQPQLSALRLLLADLHNRYPRITRLAGHKDLNPGQTLCPGSSLYPLLPGLAAENSLEYSA